MPHIGEENSVLSLQYPEGRHSIPIFIAYEPRRQLIQTLQTQQHNSQRQRGTRFPILLRGGDVRLLQSPQRGLKVVQLIWFQTFSIPLKSLSLLSRH